MPNEPPSQAEILQWATEGRFAETLEALEDQAAGAGPADLAFEPLNAVLEKVKNNLKDATSRSPEVEAAALACEWVLQVVPLCLKPEDKRVPGLTAKAHSRRGDALLILDDAQAALDEFDRALEIQPEDAYFRYNRGAALLALGRDEEARRDFRTAASPKHNQPGARRLAQAALERMK